MRILLIHQAFVSSDEAGGTRHFELGKRLKQKGDQLTVIASQVSYLTGTWVQPRRNGLLYVDDTPEVQVVRAYTLPAIHRGFVWRVIAFLVFSVTSVIAGLRVENIDLVMGTSPPLFQAFSAWLVALLRGKPFLLEVRDLWPEFAIGMGVLKNPMIIAAARFGERFLYNRAEHLLVNSPAYRDYLLNKGVVDSKISFVANGVETDMFDPEAEGEHIRAQYNLTNKFVITYAGAHGPANDLDTVLRAAGRLREEQNIHFLLVGDGKDRAALVAKAEQMSLMNVTFTGALPKSQMPSVLAASDACLAILMNIPMFTTTYPNKVFDYMASGRPTLLMIDGVIRETIETAHAGVFVPPGDDALLAVEAKHLSQDRDLCRSMGYSARSYVAEHFNREQQADLFREVLHALLRRKSRGYDRLKRLLDVLLAVVGLVMLSPVVFGAATAVAVTMGHPVFFCQQRPGLGGKPFTIIKFRTMRSDIDATGQPLPDSTRLTKLGWFLRSTSIDELPELINVLKGEMSFVGPRPLLTQYLNLYTPEQRRRHEVRPGITGWAQVNGRNAITWEEKFELDVWYVDHRSFMLDIKILLRTFWKVIKREGISQEGQVTMTEFLGSPPKSDL